MQVASKCLGALSSWAFLEWNRHCECGLFRKLKGTTLLRTLLLPSGWFTQIFPSEYYIVSVFLEESTFGEQIEVIKLNSSTFDQDFGNILCLPAGSLLCWKQSLRFEVEVSWSVKMCWSQTDLEEAVFRQYQLPIQGLNTQPVASVRSTLTFPPVSLTGQWELPGRKGGVSLCTAL